MHLTDWIPAACVLAFIAWDLGLKPRLAARRAARREAIERDALAAVAAALGQDVHS